MMKRTILLLSAAVLTAPAFADDKTLCDTNLQQLDDKLIEIKQAEPLESRVQEYIDQAKQARSQGDTKACISHSEKALQALQRPGIDGDNPG